MDLETVLNSPFMSYLGFEVEEASGDRVVARWTAGSKHHQPFGIVHGGVHASIVESLGSIGATIWLDGRGTAVGVNNTTDFYRPFSEGELVSTGVALHQGRLQQVWLVETHDTEGRLIARGQLRLQNLEPRRAV